MNPKNDEDSNSGSIFTGDKTSNSMPLSNEELKSKKVTTYDLERDKKILFEEGADAVCDFGNGKSIRVSKMLLSFLSPAFRDIFFGESPTTVVKIENFDCETFQTFLDCLFGVKEYTVLDALLIYPIAHKYDVKKCLKKCAKILIPYEMNENVCLTYNLATFYNDIKLDGEVISFLDKNDGLFNVLDTESYRNLLEPRAISRIIQEAEMNSYLWKLIYEWGDFYLKKHNKPDYTVRLLFEESDILSKLSLADFESASSILDFHDFTNRELLDSYEILNFFRDHVIENKDLPDKSLWVKVKKGDKIVEDVKFVNPIHISQTHNHRNHISTNRISFSETNKVSCGVNYFYREDTWPFEFRSWSVIREALEENIGDRNKKGFYYDFKARNFHVFAVKITYEFPCDCTILKTSLNKNLLGEQLRFTENLECS